MGLYFTIREKVRSNRAVNMAIYLGQSLVRSNFGRLAGDVRRAGKAAQAASGVALCLRFRDEARYLPEWLEYHRAAGVDHFFLYNNYSADDFRSAIQPWIDDGSVTLVDWPKTPASPAAEEDCIRRALGHFAWVGFLDADEFVVIRDGRSIAEFLAAFPKAPGVGLHWKMFGSSLHRERPASPVIVAYQRRSARTNRHIKTFVRPWRVAQCRNSHAWFYYPIGLAADEHGRAIYGSFDAAPTGDDAWINHYYCKSEEDYLEKAARRSTLDRVGINFPTRTMEKMTAEMARNNDVPDSSAVDYYRARCEATGRTPKLLADWPAIHQAS